MHTTNGLRPKQKSYARTALGPSIFALVRAATEGRIQAVAETLVTTSRRSGENLVALNPTRPDKKLGSFSINIRTGVWADFATGEKGGDIISFAAYTQGLSQIEAARFLAEKLGVRV